MPTQHTAQLHLWGAPADLTGTDQSTADWSTAVTDATAAANPAAAAATDQRPPESGRLAAAAEAAGRPGDRTRHRTRAGGSSRAQGREPSADTSEPEVAAHQVAPPDGSGSATQARGDQAEHAADRCPTPNTEVPDADVSPPPTRSPRRPGSAARRQAGRTPIPRLRADDAAEPGRTSALKVAPVSESVRVDRGPRGGAAGKRSQRNSLGVEAAAVGDLGRGGPSIEIAPPHTCVDPLECAGASDEGLAGSHDGSASGRKPSPRPRRQPVSRKARDCEHLLSTLPPDGALETVYRLRDLRAILAAVTEAEARRTPAAPAGGRTDTRETGCVRPRPRGHA